ncbi:G-patch domain-containing protein, putative [Eimeria necatrix]|nr:G-patch domain-containing protein, putative [Eimeria necatrix]CDJ68449.1 G-patch domain-containing protein, putative [Eimeria necatrix]
MSKAFAARLLKTDGCRSKPFHSPFAAAVLKKFGWTE